MNSPFARAFGAIHNYNGEKAYPTRSSEDVAEGKPEKIDTVRSRPGAPSVTAN